MGIKSLLRKMRVPRLIYYKIQQNKEKKVLPKEVYKGNDELIKSLKNRYKNKRCFIIGNGPSLTIEDLNKLTGEYTFASNRIFSLYNKTDWRPTFYAIQDELVLQSIKAKLKTIINNSTIGFVSMKQFKECEKELINSKNHVWFPIRFAPPKKNIYRFSNDVSKEVYEGLTITYSCIQLAVYMGFSEIYLLGVDHNYAIEIDNDGNIIKKDSSVKNYFDGGEPVVDNLNLPKVVEMTRAYLSAEKHSRRNGYRIYNATRGGKLEAFERVEFDEIIKQ